jgi:hypothetical protein
MKRRSKISCRKKIQDEVSLWKVQQNPDLLSLKNVATFFKRDQEICLHPIRLIVTNWA